MNVVRLWKLSLMCTAAVVVLVGTSFVMAGPVLYEIAPVSDGYGTATTSEGHAITPDGKYVAVAVDGSTTAGDGAIWDVVNGTRRVRDVPGNLSENATGIGYFTVDESERLVVHAPASGPKDCYWISADGGATWGRYKAGISSTGGSVAVASTGTSNTLAGSGSGDTFYGAFDETSLKLWGVKGTGDAPPTFVGSGKSTTTAAGTKGVSSASPAAGKEYRVVGYRKDAGGNPQNYVMDYDGTTGSPANWYALGLQGNTLGELWAINADTGTRAGGRSPHPAKTGLWAFICDDPVSGGGTATELPTFNPLAEYTSNSIVYGLSPDGDFAVGMDYTNGVERAVLWDISDPDSANWTERDLTQFASNSGILGNFTRLARGYAVGVNAYDEPVITGFGVTAGGTRGYVLTVPEPGTVALLVIGGLVLLLFRRRR